MLEIQRGQRNGFDLLVDTSRIEGFGEIVTVCDRIQLGGGTTHNDVITSPLVQRLALPPRKRAGRSPRRRCAIEPPSSATSSRRVQRTTRSQRCWCLDADVTLASTSRHADVAAVRVHHRIPHDRARR
ncbi:MAG: hypothetical protein WKF58_11825 [Ilumatobacteraceae bacterium]